MLYCFQWQYFEMGSTSLTNWYNGLYKFRFDHLADQATTKDGKMINFCRNHLLSSPLRSMPNWETFLILDFFNLKAGIWKSESRRKIYCGIQRRTCRKRHVGRFGNSIRQLGRFWIPKILDEISHPIKWIVVNGFGLHQKLRDDKKMAHCSRTECVVFADLVRVQL